MDWLCPTTSLLHHLRELTPAPGGYRLETRRLSVSQQRGMRSPSVSWRCARTATNLRLPLVRLMPQPALNSGISRSITFLDSSATDSRHLKHISTVFTPLAPCCNRESSRLPRRKSSRRCHPQAQFKRMPEHLPEILFWWRSKW